MENIIDELTYQNYKHNRRRSPAITPQEWALIFSNIEYLEKRFQEETSVPNVPFIEEYERQLKDVPRCHWCGRFIFKPESHNLVHVGGEPNDVYACDDYLKGQNCMAVES